MRTLLLLCCSAIGVMGAEPTTKPNVLFLFADDQRADTIAALGNPVIKTPNLDALVTRGFTFSNAYCFGANSAAVCLPSRNMLLCGRAYFRYKGQATPDMPNLAGVFKSAGYETYHHGKKGNVATELNKVFDHNLYLKNDDAERRSGTTGQEIVDPALTFLKNRQRDKPFCMYLAFANPHDPRGASEKHLAMYDRKKMALPKNFMPLHPFNNGELLVRDEQLAPWPRTEDDTRKQLHDYYAAITGLDEQIGRLLAALKELKLDSNTIIVYSADHGLAMGSHGLFGKQSLYEHSMKAPLIVAGPTIKSGQSAAFAYLFDIFPTLCDLAGLKIPTGLDGQSLGPVIRGEKKGIRNTLFTSYRDVQRSIRQDNWKLIRYPKINKSQLFDLTSDPDEIHDLAGEAIHKERVASMLALMAKQQQHYGDSLALTSEKPLPAEVTLDFFKVPPPKKKKP